MTRCFFVSDLHGREPRYAALAAAVRRERPAAVFLGGDLLPHALTGGFAEDVLVPLFASLRDALRDHYPRVFLILGNDDPRREELALLAAQERGLWEYLHMRRSELAGCAIYGYSHVPPTPFRLKDWERYDVSRFVDPGCVSPEEGLHTFPVPEGDLRHGTIATDLVTLVGEADVSRAVCLFHSPPYKTQLDRAALDGRIVEHVPLDVHVGSIAIRRFIESRQPLLMLHGHVHESARLTGAWRDRIGATWLVSAAHDGPELALVRFDLEAPEDATRELLAPP
jgi:Icc-related predicted phosphoesterase